MRTFAATGDAPRQRLRQTSAEDLRYSGESSWRVSFYLTRRALYYQRVLRHAEYWEAQSGVLPAVMLAIYKLRLMRLSERIGINIPRGTCGPGLSIAHPGLIVVNGDARVGARCRISHGVTIGGAPSGAPVLGDDVFLGPGAQVIGAVRVGDGATILPGAVATKDVPPHSTVGGIPAEVVRGDTPPWHQSIYLVGRSRVRAKG